VVGQLNRESTFKEVVEALKASDQIETEKLAAQIGRRQVDRALKKITKDYLREAVSLLKESKEDIETWMEEDEHFQDEFGQECSSHETVRKINEFLKSLPIGIYTNNREDNFHKGEE
jgi:hypothetical protein